LGGHHALVDRGVARQATQPRAQLVVGVTGAQRIVRADQDVLHDVLGIVLRAAQQAGGVARQRDAMARVERRERRAIACADAAGQLGVIGAQTSQDDGGWRVRV